MHTQAKFALWLSIFLSSCLALVAIVSPAPAEPKVKLATEAQPNTSTTQSTGGYHDHNAELVAAIKLAQQAQADELARQQEEAARSAPPPTTQPPKPKPVPAGSAEVEDAVRTYFPAHYESAMRVADCESSLISTNVSPDGANHGLFQINVVHREDFESFTGHPWSDIYDPYLNAQYAAKLSGAGSHWGSWSCAWAA